ncbi:MAG: hypothetical protein ACKVT0_05435 [Planctomycetaceae bacterium]
MPVKVRCSNCEKVVNAPDAAQGKAIRCPNCKNPIRVPAPSAGAKKKPEKKEHSPEELLGNIDLSRAADDEVKFCINCHAELPYVDEDDEEEAGKPIVCTACGVDQETGQLTKKAKRIKELKGVDPDQFHKNFRANSWKFMTDNAMLALRTSIYMVVTSNLSFFCLFMVLYCTNTPPKVFWSIFTFVTLMITPGWTWFLTSFVIKTTLDKVDVIKKVNFDFFLCSALGIKALVWQLCFLSPFWLAGGAMHYFAEMELWMCALPILVGFVLVTPVMPVVMAHMSMPITGHAWLPHKMLPIFFRNAKACFHWAFWAALTSLPVLLIWGLIIFFFGNNLEAMYNEITRNTAIEQAKLIVADLGEVKRDLEPEEKTSLDAAKALAASEQTIVDYTKTFIPNAIWLVSCMYYGFFVLFNMRGIGLFTAVFKRELDLISAKKELKFVSSAEKKRRRDELKRQKQEEKRKANEVVFDEDELEDEDEDDDGDDK